MDTDSESKFLTAEDVAHILQVDIESVRRYVRSGELKSLSLGNKLIRISPTDLEDFLLQRRIKVNRPGISTEEGGAEPPAKPGTIWHSPPNTYWHIQKAVGGVTWEEFQKHPDFKVMREAQIASVVALMLFQIRNIPAFIQLYKPDPPDALIMQPSLVNRGQQDITSIEITQYRPGSDHSLLDQLRRKKIRPGVKYLSPLYILVVDLWPGLEVDFEELKDYLNDTKVEFPVWVIQETQRHPDTLADLVIVNPDVKRLSFNLGEAAHTFKQLNIPDVLKVKRVGSKDLVRMEKAEKLYDAPWETIGR